MRNIFGSFGDRTLPNLNKNIQVEKRPTNSSISGELIKNNKIRENSDFPVLVAEEYINSHLHYKLILDNLTFNYENNT